MKISEQFQHEELLHKNIRLADQKAIAFITVNGLLLVTGLRLFEDLGGIWRILGMASYIGLFLIIALFFWVLKPRGRRTDATDDNIVFCKDSSILVEKLSDEDAVRNDLAKIIAQRARINRKKYDALELAIYVCAAGWIGLLVLGICYVSFA